MRFLNNWWSIDRTFFRGAAERLRSGQPASGRAASEAPPEEAQALHGPPDVRNAGRIQIDEEGIAHIPIVGMILKDLRGAWWYDGCSSFQLRTQLRAVAQMPAVRGIMLWIDSPGGLVAGSLELYEEIRRTAAVKPLHAFTEDLCASAAYWAACGAGRITAGRAAWVGSIGTYGVLWDTSKAFEEMGAEVLVFSTGDFKGMGEMGSRITEQQRVYFQGIIDEMNKPFLASVQQARGLSAAELRGIADGRVFVAREAKQLGLIDRIGTAEDALDGLRVALAAVDRRRRIQSAASRVRIERALESS